MFLTGIRGKMNAGDIRKGPVTADCIKFYLNPDAAFETFFMSA
jgi:hypothetical protein